MITAKILLDSVYVPTGSRITTFELEYPRFILAEFNTHRLFSRNSASSRAIPVAKMQELIRTRPAQPVHWGLNKPGMQADEEIDADMKRYVQTCWLEARDSALRYSELLAEFGVHKQVTNRVTEPYQLIKTVCTATEWANFWHLRDHKDTQPEFRELARQMHQLYRESQPKPLRAGDWHLPYVIHRRSHNGDQQWLDASTGLEITLDQARKVSASCCAQVSYRVNDATLDKAERIYQQLIESEPAHASPVEHQATPVTLWDNLSTDGITHQDKWGHFWSGNFRGWIQFRKLIPGEARWW